MKDDVLIIQYLKVYRIKIIVMTLLYIWRFDKIIIYCHFLDLLLFFIILIEYPL